MTTNDPLEGIDLAALLEHGRPVPNLPPPADAQPMVKTSIKLPVDLFAAIGEEAEKAGVGRSTLIRQAIEVLLAERRGQQVLVSLADVQSALAALARRATPAA
jgi:hypothetical protein